MKKTVITQKNGKFTLLSMNSRIFHRVGEDTLDHAAILASYLKKAFQLDQKSIDSILAHGKIVKDGETSTDIATAENIVATLTTLDKTRIGGIKQTAETESYQKGFNKAKGEALTAHEEEIKTKYGITSDLKGAELYDHILAEKLKASGTSDDDIKKSATYQREEARWKKELKEAKEAGENKVKELETTYKKEGTFTKVGQSAIDILTGLNPVLPKNATVAETYKKDFLNELKGYEYELHDDNKIVVMKDGKVLDDGHGNTLAYEDHVKKIAANRFEFAVNNDNENSGDKNDLKKKGKTGVYPAGINKPKNVDELSALMSSDKISLEDRRIIANEYRDRTTAN